MVSGKEIEKRTYGIVFFNRKINAKVTLWTNMCFDVFAEQDWLVYLFFDGLFSIKFLQNI